MLRAIQVDGAAPRETYRDGVIDVIGYAALLPEVLA